MGKGGLNCKERQGDVGSGRPAGACKKGGDLQISSVKRLLSLHVENRGGGGQKAAGKLLEWFMVDSV